MRVTVALLALATLAIAQDSPWEMRELPAPEEWIYTTAFDVNNHGDAVGRYAISNWSETRPILWRDGTWFDLGIEYGQPDGWLYGGASGIDDSGRVAGTAYKGYGDYQYIAVIWDTIAGTWQSIHPAAEGFSNSLALDISESGKVLLYLVEREPELVTAPYVGDLETGEGRRLPVPAQYLGAQGMAVNDSGWVAGYAGEPDPSAPQGYRSHAVVWDPEGDLVDLHPHFVAMNPRVHSSDAIGITNSGEVFGVVRFETDTGTEARVWSWRPGEQIRFLDAGGETDIFLIAACAHGRAGFGSIGPIGPGTLKPAVWLDGILHQLPSMDGFGNVCAQGMNDRGVIVGSAIDEGGWWWEHGGRAFIAVPRDEGDYDGDALRDKWELAGYVHDNGESVDLFAMGANPLRRDLFVEVDAMEGHRPDPEALQPVIDAFAAHDIALHIDIDDNLPLDPELGTLDEDDRYQWDDFDLLKTAHFEEELESAVRYCVFAHRLATLTDSGLARGEPSSDFIVSLGAFGPPDPWMQAGTFMHELGHVLGLRHGGADVTNRKPNYLSVMNYDFQKAGLRIDGQDGHFDYSTVQLSDLDESALSEGAGLGATAAGYQTLFRIVTIDPVTFEETVEAVWSGDVQDSIDWDGSGAIEAGSVDADLNGDGVFEMLRGHDDWANLDFNGGTVGYGVGIPPPPPPEETKVEELTVEEAKVIPPPPVEGLVGRAGRGSVRLSWTPVGPYGQGTYKVYRVSGDDRTLVAETHASLISDRPGRGTWNYVVTVTDALGAESMDSETLTLRSR